MVPRSKRDDPGASITFLLAAVSKAVASSVTYPVSLAKARAQVNGSSSAAPDAKKNLEKLAEDVKDATKNGTTSSSKEARKHLAQASKQAGRNTIIHSILKIYMEEGISGLYEGIGGEIIKGFLGHGLTMIVKDRVHEIILSLYFMVLKLLKRSPSPQEIINDAKDKVIEGRENLISSVKAGSEEALQTLKNKSEDALQSGKDVVSSAQDSASQIPQSVSNITNTVINGAKNYADKTRESLNLPTAGDAAEKVGKIGDSTTEKAKAAGSKLDMESISINKEEYVNEEAGHLLGNAGEQLGETIKGRSGEIKRVGKAGKA